MGRKENIPFISQREDTDFRMVEVYNVICEDVHSHMLIIEVKNETFLILVMRENHEYDYSHTENYHYNYGSCYSEPEWVYLRLYMYFIFIHSQDSQTDPYKNLHILKDTQTLKDIQRHLQTLSD